MPELKQLLRNILDSVDSKRSLLIREYEDTVGESQISGNQSEVEAIEDLAHDLAFYTNDSIALAQDPALFGDQELDRRVRSVLEEIC